MPLGLDLDRYAAVDDRRGELCAELGVSRDVPLVAIVARLVPIKAHEMFLRAAARVRERLPTSQFLVVGDGERRQALETLAGELGLGASVRFLGWRRDLERVYADAWVVALTSRNEGSPVSLIEAMAAGRPVVATRVGGVPDLVEEGVTGHLVPPGDADALARAMTDLLLDAGRRRAFGQAARARVVGFGRGGGGVCRPSGRAGSWPTWTRFTRSCCGPRASRCRGEPRGPRASYRALRLPRRSPAC